MGDKGRGWKDDQRDKSAMSFVCVCLCALNVGAWRGVKGRVGTVKQWKSARSECKITRYYSLGIALIFVGNV